MMDVERFRPLMSAPGPFVSLYLDDSRDAAEALVQLEARWRGLRRRLTDDGVDEKTILAIEDAVLRSQPAVGRQGRAVIASGDRIWINEHLVRPPLATVLRVSDYPYILPLVELGPWRPTYLVAAVDRAGADITLHHGAVVRSEKVDGGGYPIHKPATAGFEGYGDLQKTTEEAIRTNVRAVADRLTELTDESAPTVVFITGEVRSRSDIVSAVPDRVSARVVQLQAGARASGGREYEIGDLVDAEFDRRRRTEIGGVAERFRNEHGRSSGLAAEGLGEVCAALRAGAVDTLIVGGLGDRTVVTGQDRTVVAPDPDVLSELGQAPYRVARADEALPFAAITAADAVVQTDDLLAPEDGVAALLRYALG